MTQDTTPTTQADALLTTCGLTAGYGKRHVISDVTLRVGRGEVVGVVGHNGAGKTTLLKCLFGLLAPASGDAEFDGDSLRGASSVQTVRRGMSFTPAETPIFRDLTVRQNLELGAYTVGDRAELRDRTEEVVATFPVLADRMDDLAGEFSGGQQRQLSLGIALMARPKLMLLDEPSLGISPAVVERTFATIKQLAGERGTSVLVVEQNLRAVIAIADRVYVLRNGAIALEETGAEAARRENWWDLF